MKLTSEALSSVYGADAARQRERYAALEKRFEAAFGKKPSLIVSAPGRTEIAGNHTDHNHGRVLAAAISMDTLAAVRARDDLTVRLCSEGYAPLTLDLTDPAPRQDEIGTTAALVRGVAAEFQSAGRPVRGFDAVCASTVLRASGLSSSAAFEVLLCAVLDALFSDFSMDAKTRAVISQRVENQYFGKPCGLMDQTASSVGGLVAIDFQNPDPRITALQYDFERKGYSLCVTQAGGDHANLTADYAAIPAEMKQVAKALGGELLRDIAPAVIEEKAPLLRGRVPDRAILRALHFIDEDARVPRLVEALQRDDLSAFLAGIVESGLSSERLLQNVCAPRSESRDLCLALELSRRMLEGRGAWRVHGGGFAGTILAFVPTDLLPAYRLRMNAVFGDNACLPLRIRPVGAAFFTL